MDPVRSSRLNPNPNNSNPNTNTNTSSSLSKSFSNANNTTQNLSSILNNPHNSLSDNSWSTWWYSSSTTSQPPQLTDFTPPNAIKTLTNFSRSDFNPYVSSLSDHYSRFEDIRNHANVEKNENVTSLLDDDVMADYIRIRRMISNARLSLSRSFRNANTTQNLSSILNNPHNSLSANSWSTCWYSSSTTSQPPQLTDFAPPNAIKTLTNFSRSDFNPYVSSLSDHYSRFEDIRNHANVEKNENVTSLLDDDVMADYIRIRRMISNARSSVSRSFRNANTTQNLSSILNNPHNNNPHNSLSDNSWSMWWYSSSTTSQPPQLTDFAPPNAIKTLTNFARSDFNPYVSSLSDHYSRFEDIRNHASVEDRESVTSLLDDDVMAGC